MGTVLKKSDTLEIENKGRFVNLTLGNLFICEPCMEDLVDLVCLDDYHDGEIKLIVERICNRLDMININYKELLHKYLDSENNVDEILQGIKFIAITDNETGGRYVVEV